MTVVKKEDWSCMWKELDKTGQKKRFTNNPRPSPRTVCCRVPLSAATVPALSADPSAGPFIN